MTSFIDDNKVEHALDILRETARNIGDARGNLVYCQEMLKHIEALEAMKHWAEPVGARTIRARASDAYRKAIDNLAQATATFETMKAERESASTLISAWQTLNKAEMAFKL